LKVWLKKTGHDATQDKRAISKLRREVERAKKVLSAQTQVRIDIEAFHEGKDFSETLSRARFEELNMDLFRKTLDPIDKVLADANLKKQDIHEVVLVGGSTRIPKIQQLLKTHFNGKEPSRGINPDEAVAFGAALQAGVMTGEDGTEKVLLIDIVSLSKGIETAGGVMSVIIPGGTSTPIRKSQIFSTYQDNQERVSIRVFEGERPLTKDNQLLGTFELAGIPASPRGTPQIEVTFDVDVNGILTVTAQEKKTGNVQQVTITGESGRLSQAEIAQMVDEAEAMAEEDKIIKEGVAARHELENLVYSVKNRVNDEENGMKEKLSTEEVEHVQAAVNEVITWLDEHMTAEKKEYEEKKDEFNDVIQPIFVKLQGDQGFENGGDF